MKTVIAVLFAGLLTAIAVPVASAAPAPPLCPTETEVAVPTSEDTWAYNALTRIDIYVETNGVFGLQIGSCTTLDGIVAPGDTYNTSIFLPVCLNVPGIGHVCIL